jgi:hypothetical protein
MPECRLTMTTGDYVGFIVLYVLATVGLYHFWRWMGRVVPPIARWLVDALAGDLPNDG